MVPSFVDEEKLLSAIAEESADALKYFANERLLETAWIEQVTLVDLELRKASGKWELEFPGMPGLDPGVFCEEHVPPESLEAHARISWRPFLRSAQDEVSANSKNVPANITDPNEAGVFFPKYQAILLLRSIFTVEVIRD